MVSLFISHYIVKTIGAHKKLLWDSVNSFSQGLRSGNYEIQWRANGDIVHVTTWVVSGTDSADTSTTAPHCWYNIYW